MMNFKPGDIVTDSATKTLRGTIVEPTPPITARNVGRGNVLVQWAHLSSSQPERAELLEKVGAGPTVSLNGEGGLNIGIAHSEKGTILLDFGKPVAWIALEPPNAVKVALSMLSHAGANIRINVGDGMVARAKDFLARRPHGDPETNDAWLRSLLEFALHGVEEAPK